MIGVIHKLGSTAKCSSFRNGTDHMVNGVLVVDVMQVGRAALAVLVHKKNLVIRVEMHNAVLWVEARCKPSANMIMDHDRITHMQISHGCERWFWSACMSHADVQSSKSPGSLQGFQGDVTRISTQMASLDTEQFVEGSDGVMTMKEKEGAVQRVLVGHEIVCRHRIW